MSDADLVALARSGDADGFRVLVSRYRAMAMSVALHLSGDREAAEDLVQEATLAAFVSLGRLPAQARNDASGRSTAPQNLQFTEGLEHWFLRGSFLKDASGGHWQDYACGTGPGPDAATASGYLKAQVPGPAGFADLRQGILADGYRGRCVRLSAHVKTADTTLKAGLYLRVIDPARSRPPEVREQLSLHGTTGWTRQHVEADVPADSVYVLFGITLTGPGQIWATNIQVEPA